MKIGLIGTFDVENYGDCLFPEVWSWFIHSQLSEAKIELLSPTDRSAKILSFDRVYKLPSSLGEPLLSSDGSPFDVLILCGGETIGIGHGAGTYIFPEENYSAYLRLWLAPLMAALQSRNGLPPATRFIAHSVGLAPGAIQTDLIAPILSAADRIAFRDSFSIQRLESSLPMHLQGKNLFCLAVDPMFLLAKLQSVTEWQNLAMKFLPQGYLPNKYLTVQVSFPYIAGGQQLDALIEGVYRAAVQLSVPVLFIPACHFLNDEVVLQLLRQRLSALGIVCGVVSGRINVKATAAIISSTLAVISTSLHVAVTGVAFGRRVAVLAMNRTGKHQGTLAAVGLHNAVVTNPTDIPDILAQSSSIDLSRIAANAEQLALRDLDFTFAVLRGERNLNSECDLKTISGRINELIAFEQASVHSNQMLRIRRALFRNMRRVPALQKLYDSYKIKWRLRVI